MPRVLIAGAPTGCWTNLGDEAIFAGMLDTLRAAVPGASVTVVSSCPEGFFDRYDCAAVPFREVAGLVEAVAASDLVVLGGGSIFFDYWTCDPATVLTPQHSGLALWTGLSLLAASAGRPVMLYGVGVGPLRTDAGTLLARTVFEIAGARCVRDADAVTMLASLGFGTESTTLAGDPVVAWDPPPSSDVGGSRPLLGVALREWDVDVDAELWQGETAAAIDGFLDEHGGTAVFVPCHRRVGWPLTDDTGAAEAVRARMRHRDRTVDVDVDLPWQRRAAILAGCDQVLAMRYHGSLVAMASGTPAVGISYDPKVAGLFADWEVPHLAVPIDQVTTEGLLDRLGEVRHGGTRLTGHLHRRARVLRERERGNADHARALLADGSSPSALGRATRELVDGLVDTDLGRVPAAAEALATLRTRVAQTSARGTA